ncbi:MAG: nuclear transport factor 2 family protein [Rhodothermales bacterium]|nr:nuclear transport factor 2 family protein [Rhodothermales bacterium]
MLLRFRPVFLLASILSLPLISIQAQDAATYQRLPSIDLPDELDRVLRDYEVAWEAGDSTGLAALFTPDGFVSSRFGWIRGTDAIVGKYANAGGDLRLRSHAYASDDSVAYIIGAYGYGDDAATVDRGKFVLALRMGPNGTWLIAADLDNSNRP